jgi:hypothetical protein
LCTNDRRLPLRAHSHAWQNQVVCLWRSVNSAGGCLRCHPKGRMEASTNDRREHQSYGTNLQGQKPGTRVSCWFDLVDLMRPEDQARWYSVSGSFGWLRACLECTTDRIRRWRACRASAAGVRQRPGASQHRLHGCARAGVVCHPGLALLVPFRWQERSGPTPR